jgi:hypothetical protein
MKLRVVIEPRLPTLAQMRVYDVATGVEIGELESVEICIDREGRRTARVRVRDCGPFATALVACADADVVSEEELIPDSRPVHGAAERFTRGRRSVQLSEPFPLSGE